MEIIKFSDDFLQQLTNKALDSQRGRQHSNVHMSFDEPCQKLFNAIMPDSYIRPHRHSGEGKDECMIGVRGALTLLVFDESGTVIESVHFGVDGEEANGKSNNVGVQIPAGVWHTIIASRPGSVLFEVKSGPFNPAAPKEFAPWAPAEDSPAAASYFAELRQLCA